MTPKVGEGRTLTALRAPAGERKSLKFCDFSVLPRGVLPDSVSGPAAPPGRSLLTQPEGRTDVDGPFTRGGTGLEGESAGSSATLDALEFRLSRPGTSLVRVDVTKVAPVVIDAADLAALERVVERISFGSDRSAATVRLELGGIWAGAVLLVRASGRQVELQLELARGGVASRELGERLAARLRSRGFAIALSFS